MESMEYEQVRNLTLLFFFERLIDKNEPRTLHDLSCQFGAPGFTKEMRQIAGGSESGNIKLTNVKYIQKLCQQTLRTRDEELKQTIFNVIGDLFVFTKSLKKKKLCKTFDLTSSRNTLHVHHKIF